MVLTYAIVTPARDEAENLHRLAASVVSQSVTPDAWVVVDDGSTDGTVDLVRSLARRHPWISLRSTGASQSVQRGRGVVRAFHLGLEALGRRTDVVVKLDADVSMEGRYFERLLAVLEREPRLGIASGGGYELQADGSWRLRPVAPGHAWGANRAYRWDCLQQVLPLEEAMGWDGIDELKAAAAGWETGTISGIPFKHHRVEGERDGARTAGWAAQGRASHYMGYRVSYLLLRTLHHVRRDPAALALVRGYLAAAWARAPRCPDRQLRAQLRRDQRWRSVVRRARGLSSSGRPAAPLGRPFDEAAVE